MTRLGARRSLRRQPSYPHNTLERTPDEIYEELRELRLTAQRVADNIADVASAIQYFTNNLFDEQHNPELADIVREIGEYLSRVVAATSGEATETVERASEAVEESVNGVLQQQDEERSTQEEPEAAIATEQRMLFAGEVSSNGQAMATSVEPSASESRESQAGGMDSFAPSTNDQHHRPAEPSADAATHPLSEAIYEPFGFLDRVAYAKHCLLSGTTDHRDFDTCFEMHDGEFVVVRLLQLAENDSQLMQRLQEMKMGDVAGTDGEDYLPLSLEELTHRARQCVGAHQVGQGILNPEFADQTSEADEQPPAGPYTFEDWQAFHERLEQGDMTAEGLKQQFQQIVDHEEPIIAALVKNHNAKQLKAWCRRWGRRDESTKLANATTIYHSMLSSYALGQTISYRPFDGETYQDAVAKAIEAVTDEDIAQVAASRQQEKYAHEKAITDPETFEEWRLYVRTEGGYQNLSPDQKIAYERVCADHTRAARAASREKTIDQLELDEDLSFTIKQGYHEKKQRELWIVQLSSRVERSTFAELKGKAKELGGWYSSFKKDDAGFQFYDEASAKLFTDLLDGDVDNSEAVAARKIRQMTNASERFHAVADTLQERCEQVLEDDESKLKNTARRASIAAGMREDAQGGLATVKTLRALGDQLAAGEIKYLDGLNAATQLYTLTQLLRAGKYDRIRQETNAVREDRTGVSSHLRYEELSAQPLCEADIAFVQYPHPHIYREHLEQAFVKLGDTPGVKRSTAKMRKLIGTADADKTTIEFKNERAVEVLADFLQRAKGAGYNCYWFEHCLERYKRMRATNIHNVFELRTALRELLPYVAKPEGDDPVMQAEDALRGKKLEGFFPTPRRVIHQMLEQARIHGTDRVLEPSVGKGDMLDAIAEAHPDVELHGIEYNRTLQDVLVAKGYEDVVTFGDFLQHERRYDKIVMNPPFEKGADIDHVRHAYELLEEDGRVVAIMSQGPFFRSDNKSREFREWLESLDYVHDEELPEEAFQGVDAFRQTGVRTRLVVIDKA